MFEIDWDSEDERGRRRRKASTIHGWLCMWRGTLAGNERVRQRGRREMKEARALRAYHQRRGQAAAGGGNGPFSLFRLGSGTRKAASPAPPHAPPSRTPQRQKSHNSQQQHHRSGSSPQNRPAPVKRKSTGGSKHASPARRQEPMRQRSSHSAKSRPSTSRRPSTARH